MIGKLKRWQIYLPSLIQVGRTVCQESIQNERVRYLTSPQVNAMISLLLGFFLQFYVVIYFCMSSWFSYHEQQVCTKVPQQEKVCRNVQREVAKWAQTTLNNIVIIIVIDVIIPLNTVIIIIVHDVIFTLLLGNVIIVISVISMIFAQILWSRSFWSRFVIKIRSLNVETLRLRSVHQLRSAKRSGSLWI